MNLKYFLILAFFVLFVGNAFASNWYFGYGNGDYYFEISNNGSWHRTSTPYSFYYDGYYFFDNSFRYYYNGAYNYYPSGWYDLGAWNYNPYTSSGAWTYNPWDGSYASYYSPYYYYWEYDWQYNPSWTNIYAGTYYNYYPSNYIPSGNYYGYNGQGYYNSGDMTGSGYTYEQEASCSELYISSPSITINPNETKEIEINAKNNSDYYFYLSNATVYIDSWNVNAKVIKFDKEIANGKTGKIKIELTADEDAEKENTYLRIKLNGRFADTVNCSSDDLQKKISINVNGNSSTNSGNQTAYSYTYYGSYDSYEEPGTWKDSSNYYFEEDEEEIIEPELNDAPNPNMVSIHTHSISVEAGKTAYTTFILQNMSSWDLLVDSVELEEQGNNYSAGAKMVDRILVPAKGFGSIQVNVSAQNVSEETVSYGRLIVNAHFREGTPVYTEEGVNVYISKKENVAEFKEKIESFELIAPKEVNYDSGAEFAVYLNNPFDSQARVYVSCDNCTLNKDKILIEGKEKKTEIIKVSGVSKDSVITYSIRMSGKYFQNKLTNVNFIEEELIEEENNSDEKQGFVSIQKMNSVVNENNEFIKITLKNYSNKEKEIELNFEEIKGKVLIDSMKIILKANESKELIIPFKVKEFTEGKAEIILLMNYDNGFDSRKIEFIEEKTAKENNEESTAGLMGTAFTVLGNNTLLGLILIFITLIIFIAYKQYKKTKQEEIIVMETN
ncbi:MAG: hypothetical protein JW703_01355 [Candidatus Diapherotrites archaeon]|nr:hypothetical protein [Candidatus Diapherotrites archaeon]